MRLCAANIEQNLSVIKLTYGRMEDDMDLRAHSWGRPAGRGGGGERRLRKQHRVSNARKCDGVLLRAFTFHFEGWSPA